MHHGRVAPSDSFGIRQFPRASIGIAHIFDRARHQVFAYCAPRHRDRTRAGSSHKAPIRCAMSFYIAGRRASPYVSIYLLIAYPEPTAHAQVPGCCLVVIPTGRNNVPPLLTKCLSEKKTQNFNQAVFILAFFSRRQDRELRGAVSRGLLDCPCRL
jgi:hypothetical protein